MTLEQLDELNVIHVAGTKGKGSVCALCESILRHHGLKTGFYSSPHLVEVRERIRINGTPLSHKEFTSYFWDVYNSLYQQKVCFIIYYRINHPICHKKQTNRICLLLGSYF